jgi:hypothetical protein
LQGGPTHGFRLGCAPCRRRTARVSAEAAHSTTRAATSKARSTREVRCAGLAVRAFSGRSAYQWWPPHKPNASVVFRRPHELFRYFCAQRESSGEGGSLAPGRTHSCLRAVRKGKSGRHFNERAAAKSSRAARRRDGRTIVEPPAPGGETASVEDAEGPASRRRGDDRAKSVEGSRCSAAQPRVHSSALAASGVRASAPAPSSSRARRRSGPVARAPSFASRGGCGPRRSNSGRPGRGARRHPRRAEATRRPSERRPRQYADGHPRDRASARLAGRRSAAATRRTCVVRCARVGFGHRGICPSAPRVEARRRDRPSRPGMASDQTALAGLSSASESFTPFAHQLRCVDTIVPWSPTAHASPRSDDHAACSDMLTPLAGWVHRPPDHWKRIPSGADDPGGVSGGRDLSELERPQRRHGLRRTPLRSVPVGGTAMQARRPDVVARTA